MRQSRAAGLVLFNCMLLLSIVAVLVLSEMQWLHLQWKAMGFILREREEAWALEEAALSLVKRNPEELAQGSKGGWQGKYQYFVEDFGLLPCVLIKEVSARHWRLTLIAKAPKWMQLQIGLMQPAAVNSCQEEVFLRVKSGISSWNLIK